MSLFDRPEPEPEPLPTYGDTDWEGPILCPSQAITTWIVRVLSEDLARWGPDRHPDIERDEAVGLVMYLLDHLPPDSYPATSKRKVG